MKNGGLVMGKYGGKSSTLWGFEWEHPLYEWRFIDGKLIEPTGGFSSKPRLTPDEIQER
jgi:hypothetical protein